MTAVLDTHEEGDTISVTVLRYKNTNAIISILNSAYNNYYGGNSGYGYGSGYGNSYGGGYGNGSYGGYSDSGRQTGRRLKRSATNRMVCGVCAGIAEYFNWDPTIIRIIWVAASIFLGAGFLGVIAYFIVAVIMPER